MTELIPSIINKATKDLRGESYQWVQYMVQNAFASVIEGLKASTSNMQGRPIDAKEVIKILESLELEKEIIETKSQRIFPGKKTTKIRFHIKGLTRS